MPQTICSKCFAKLTATERRENRLLCHACENQWKLTAAASPTGASRPVATPGGIRKTPP